MNRYIAALLFSSLLHGLVLVALKKSRAFEDPKVNFTPKGGDEIGEDTSIIPGVGSIGQETCEGAYEGIGITLDWDGTVTSAPAGYPAARGGIRVGDNVGEGDPMRFRGPVGTSVDLDVVRGSKVLKVHLVRERICAI